MFLFIYIYIHQEIKQIDDILVNKNGALRPIENRHYLKHAENINFTKYSIKKRTKIRKTFNPKNKMFDIKLR